MIAQEFTVTKPPFRDSDGVGHKGKPSMCVF